MDDETLIAGHELELRPVTETIESSLIEAVRESRAQLAPWMFWATDDYGPQDAQVFLGLVASGRELAFGITDANDGSFHGLCSLNRIDEVNRTANLGYWLRTTSTGRGRATCAVRRLLVHAFEDLDLQRVEILIASANTRSVGVVERLRLSEEGLRRRAIRVGEEQHDARVFTAFPSDLERLRQAPTDVR